MDGARFVDTRSGETFVPRGVNLLLKTGGGGADKLFQLYDSEWVEEQLEQIAALDLNTVRFFLDMCMRCTSTEDGIREDYLDDLADLLTRLEAHGLVALPTSNDVPDPGYSDRLPCCEPFGGYRNSIYLTSEGHQIAIDYWTDLITGVQERGAPTHHLLGWQLANEQFFLRDVPPINLSSGTATAADGVTYELADDQQVEDMLVTNLTRYVDTVGDTIRDLDPGALISMGFITPSEIDGGRVEEDNRWALPARIHDEARLDFFDFHGYPGLGGTWDYISRAYGFPDGDFEKPAILGEYGAFEVAYTDPEDGAAAMARWQAASCELGIDGWLLWFWGAEQDDEVYPVNVADAAIARAGSPEVRPDPCVVGPYASENLALERPVTASLEESEEYGAAQVADGSDATWWSAAEGPPQWVEIDLGADMAVGRVEISIGFVSPDGPQTHQVSVGSSADGGAGTLVAELAADARQGDVLVAEFEPRPDVRYVRVDTVAVDGWVILHEIRVLAG